VFIIHGKGRGGEGRGRSSTITRIETDHRGGSFNAGGQTVNLNKENARGLLGKKQEEADYLIKRRCFSKGKIGEKVRLRII